ncbi:MAG: hypothetical protein P9L95_01240 [Candidatus Tenebribacter mawsonii]|nr:hypothetical protein [Candidatus Tenebribacter mawsonii]
MNKRYVYGVIVLCLIFTSLFSQTTFSSDVAIQKSNEMVDEHWKNYQNGVSRYYGWVWLKNYAEQQYIGNISFHDDYLQELKNRNMKQIRMDCTIYCAKVLKVGMGSQEYSKLVGFHDEIWAGKGFAGWSVGYLLVDRFGWKAYAFIEPGANYYHHYISHFKDKKEYPVWRQPNIKIEDYFILGQDDEQIEELLRKHKFSWGFSEDGIHTWITNYTDLLECHWDGSPAAKYNPNNWLPDLFETTRFIEFKDYDVHIIIVPPTN